MDGYLEGVKRGEIGYRMEGVATLFNSPSSFQQVFVHFFPLG